MQISIQSNDFVLTEALRAYTEQRLKAALGCAGTRMRKLHVSLSDINGPRGGRDKRCKIQVQLAGGKDVLIEDTEADLYHAIDRAAERADRAVVRRVEHLREFPRVRLAAGKAAAAAVDEEPATTDDR
jgi:putative sigma-54 modulation protein